MPAAGLGSLPVSGSFQITTLPAHLCLRTQGSRERAHPPEGTRQPSVGYFISEPQFLTCEMGLIVPQVVTRGTRQ